VAFAVDCGQQGARLVPDRTLVANRDQDVYAVSQEALERIPLMSRETPDLRIVRVQNLDRADALQKGFGDVLGLLHASPWEEEREVLVDLADWEPDRLAGLATATRSDRDDRTRRVGTGGGVDGANSVAYAVIPVPSRLALPVHQPAKRLRPMRAAVTLKSSVMMQPQ